MAKQLTPKKSKKEAKEEKKAKKEAKEAAKQEKLAKKKSVKLVPLIIVIVLITGLLLGRNFILKLTIRNTSQAIFGARCDIESVHYDLMTSTLRLSGYEVGNKDAPYRNLFQFETLTCGININELLYRRVHIDEVSITGFTLNTPRETSAELPEKDKKKREKKEKDTASFTIPFSDFDYKPLLTEIAPQIVAGISSSLPVTNANAVINTYMQELQTPTAAQEVQQYAQQLTETWKNRPTELQTQITDLSSRIESLSKITISTTSSLSELQNAFTSATETYNEAIALKNTITTDYNQITTDADTLEKQTALLKSAYEADKVLLTQTISNISFNTITSRDFLSDILNAAAESVLGDAKTYVDKGLVLIGRLQNGNKKEKIQKTTTNRLAGTTYTWDTEKPTLVINTIHFSGMGFLGEIKNITDNQKVTGIPTTAVFNRTHEKGKDEISLCIDVRDAEESDNIVTAQVNWNTPISPVVPGVLSLTMDNTSAQYTYSKQGESTLLFEDTLNNLEITPVPTGTQILDDILTTTLTDINDISLSCSYSSLSKTVIKTSLLSVLYSRIQNQLKEQSIALVNELNTAATDKLNEYVTSMTGQVSEFENIQQVYGSLNTSVTDLTNQAQQKLDEAKSMTNALQDSAQKALQEAESAVREAEAAAIKAKEEAEAAARAAADKAAKEAEAAAIKAKEEAEAAARAAAEKAAREAEEQARAAAENAAKEAASQAGSALKGRFGF